MLISERNKIYVDMYNVLKDAETSHIMRFVACVRIDYDEEVKLFGRACERTRIILNVITDILRSRRYFPSGSEVYEIPAYCEVLGIDKVIGYAVS